MLEIALLPETKPDLPLVAEHQPVEFAYAAVDSAQLALRIDGQTLEPFLRPGERVWRWRWNPGTVVGLRQVALTDMQHGSGALIASWPLRVVTRKIDQERYEALLEDIQRSAYGLVTTLAGAGAEGATLERAAPWDHSPAETYYALFEARLTIFERAVRRITARPREQLRGTREQTPLPQASMLGDQAIAGLARGEFDQAAPEHAPELQALLRPGGGILPRAIAATRGQPTTDSYEHRLLKHTLALLVQRARFVGGLAERESARLAANEAFTGTHSTRRMRAEQIAAGCAAATHTLRELRTAPFLAEVAPLPAFRGSTPLFQRDPAYREVYQMWQALRQHAFVAFDSPLFAIPIADLPQLYESWCALQVAQALLSLGGSVRAQELVAPRRSASDEDELDYTIRLSERVPLLVIDYPAIVLTLRYQPQYRPAAATARKAPLYSLDRHTRVPDLAIEIQRGDAPVSVLLLDAKYRLDADGRGVPQDALADAYAYLGAIGCANQRATVGALLLYPGRGADERYASGVGTIPLLPGATQALPELLRAWLGI